MVWCCKVADICYFTDTFGKHSLEILVVEPQSYHWVMSFLRGKIPFSQMDATFMADQLQVLHSKYSSVVTSRLIVREVKSAAIISDFSDPEQGWRGDIREHFCAPSKAHSWLFRRCIFLKSWKCFLGLCCTVSRWNCQCSTARQETDTLVSAIGQHIPFPFSIKSKRNKYASLAHADTEHCVHCRIINGNVCCLSLSNYRKVEARAKLFFFFKGS